MATVPISDGDPKNSYTATSGQTTFAYTFWVKDEDHIAVYVNGALKAITTDYTVSAIESVTGANIVFNSGLVEDDAVVIVYDPLFERATEFTGTIRLNALNTELTYLLSLLQSNQRKIDDALRPSDAEVVNFDGELPSLTGNGGRVLAIKSDLSGIQYRNVADNATYISNFESGTLSGTGAQTVYTLPFNVASQNSLLLFEGDTRLIPGVDYTASDADLVFTVAPASGTDNISYLHTGSAASIGEPSDGTVTTAKIVDGAVTTDKVAADAIDGTKLADNAVDSEHITDDAVTLAKIQQVATATMLGRDTAGTGNVEVLTASEARVNIDAQQDISGLAIATATVATDDKIVIQDTSDSDNIKTVTAQSIADLGGGIFTESFTSAEQTISTGGLITVAHGLSSIPKLVKVYAICKVAQGGWSIGDIVEVQSHINQVAALSTTYGGAVYKDATNINIRMGNYAPGSYFTANKTTGAILIMANTSWKLIIEAFA